MKLRAYLSILAMLSFAAPALASDRMDAAKEQKVRLELQRHNDARRYSFEDYVNDVASAARSDQPQPDNPVSQLAANEHREYKPLNPMTIFRW